MKTINKLIGCALVITSMASCSRSNDGKVAVVDLQKLYTSFNYQKELDEKFQRLKLDFTSKSDSLNKAIQYVEVDLANNTALSGEDKNIV